VRTKIVAPFIALLIALIALPACKKAADLAKYKEQAMALVAQYAPQLKDLLGKTEGLSARVKSLPVTVPGLDKVAALIENNKGAIAKLQGLVDQLPGKTADAIKAGKKADVEALLTSTTTELGNGVSKLGTDLANAEKEVGALEEAAKQLAAAPPATGDFAEKLSTGFELKGAATGIESQLVAFLKDAARPVDKDTWWNFDRLTFAAGGADLDLATSKDQLTNIAEILKAFPAATLKIGGYTDNTGAADANKKISQARADAVVKELVALGVDAKRLAAEGYGPEYPVCAANDTDECKAQNRRIAVRVTAK
jgi:outer membrane protein OmpA-like peptidoglycan-associated protein